MLEKRNHQIPDEPPSYMTGTAKYLWRKLVPVLKTESNIQFQDKTLIEALCINYQLMRNAYADIMENGSVKAAYRTVTNPTNGKIVATDFVGYKRNPSTQIFDAATTKIKSIAKDLGMTPQSRAELLDLSKDDDSGDSVAKLKELFG
ncbi:phage terminase small subunit P27 family [uncultured Secundilactobacillus sp.]|uniref:phage terminase small subunit P27 family n=1 Tax=uncultured Secundilactobacillus sp. TaxID=2813935 RepID=UPI002583CD89|nr:phage terminase small subunit P27 family [uncultured Secundilactobacillus sp.]